MSLEILLYNKVELDDGTQGIVRYIGNIQGKKGVFYGIDVTKGDAKNDGTFKKIKYFDTKKGTKTGRFCKENKIKKCRKTSYSKYPFKFDDIVMCTKTKCKGIVKYIGVPSWAKGGKVYYGLELVKKKGTCNGTNQGIQYFECKMQYGVYVMPKHVKFVGPSKKTKEEDDVKEVIRDYYKSKPDGKIPKSIKQKKDKKGDKINNNKKEKNKKKIINKQPPTEPTYLTSRNSETETNDTLDIPPINNHDPSTSITSVDYMDEEKDLDFGAYKEKTEEIDYQRAEKQRREQIQKMKEMEREDRLKREQEKKEKIIKEKEEKEKRKQELIENENKEKQKELSRKQKELKDKERLQKYAKAMKEKEEREKMEQLNIDKLESIKKENELLKQKEIEEIKKKEFEEKKEREEEYKLAEKLRKEKELKIKEEEEKKSNITTTGGVVSGGGGSLKDRMAMFQKQSNNNNNTPKIKKQYVTKNTVKKQYVAPKSNVNSGGGGGGVGGTAVFDKQINDEMNAAFGKPFKSVKMTKVSNYSGSIPLVLYLLGDKLIKLDKFSTFKIFFPSEMEKQKDNKLEMQYAYNIFLFFSKLPAPLLDTVPSFILDKALSKDVMGDVINLMDEPYASTLCYLWDILAKVAMAPNARMGQQSLGKVFGPMCTLVTQQDMKGNRVSMNVLAASRMMAFFRRGIEWRMEIQGFNFDDSDDDD